LKRIIFTPTESHHYCGMDITQSKRTKAKLLIMAVALALATIAPVAVLAGGLI